MTAFATAHVSTRRKERAPDGSDVRALLALVVIGVTMPRWPGAGEAMLVTGPWTAR